MAYSTRYCAINCTQITNNNPFDSITWRRVITNLVKKKTDYGFSKRFYLFLLLNIANLHHILRWINSYRTKSVLLIIKLSRFFCNIYYYIQIAHLLHLFTILEHSIFTQSLVRNRKMKLFPQDITAVSRYLYTMT